jgi:hypothetical protein
VWVVVAASLLLPFAAPTFVSANSGNSGATAPTFGAVLSGVPTVPVLVHHVPPVCSGSAGDRVQVLYTFAPDTNRYATVVGEIAQIVANIDDTFEISALKTDGGREVRWVADASCQPTITSVEVPSDSISSFSSSTAYLASLGYSDPHRKYLVFVDAPNAACGLSTIQFDSSPGPNNMNNGQVPQYAEVYQPCWVSGGPFVFPTTAVHELMHTLGAVQPDAPHATTHNHCWDGADIMCYDDGDDHTQRNVCPERSSYMFDCGNDDYFNTAPPAGSYLATHWNVANSSFLEVVPPLRLTPVTTRTHLVVDAPDGYISATVTDSAHRHVWGARVQLQVRHIGGRRWVALHTFTTVQDGTTDLFDVTLHSAGVQYRFVTAAQFPFTASTSKTVTIPRASRS